MRYPSYLNILLANGQAIEAHISRTPGHKLEPVRTKTGPRVWACLLETGGSYRATQDGEAAIRDLIERRPGLHWVKPLLA
jgi:hypothetical protein